MVRVGLLLCILLYAVPLEAATLCVKADGGDDTRTKATVAASWNGTTCTAPWATLGRAVWGNALRSSASAAQAATGGDTVIVTAGTYSTTQGAGSGASVLTYEPEGTGSSGSQLVFTCETWGPTDVGADGIGDCVITYDASSPGGNFIGTNGQNYVTWRGFHIDGPSNTVCVGMLINVRDTDGTIIEWNSVEGDPECLPNDNYACIWLSSGHTGVTIRNNLIYRCRNGQGGGNENGAGILVYEGGSFIIEHNEITDTGAGIAVKAPFGAGSSDIPEWAANKQYWVRFNYIHDIDFECYNVHRSNNEVDEPARWYQNICHDSSGCYVIHTFAGFANPEHIWFINNTCVRWNPSTSAWQAVGLDTTNDFPTNAGFRVRNNIFRDGGRGMSTDPAASNYVDAKYDSDYNWWSDYAGNFSFGNVNGNFANWIANTESEDNSTNGTDPQFVDEAGSDFHLAPGSGARNDCPDELDLDSDDDTEDLVACGAYVTGDEEIGRESGVGGGGSVPGSAGKGKQKIRMKDDAMLYGGAFVLTFGFVVMRRRAA